MKKKPSRFFIFLFLIISPFALIVIVNSFMNNPTYELIPEKCSRHCHNKGCVHFHNKYQNERKGNSFFLFLEQCYWGNIWWLKRNPLGLSYSHMNLLLYVFFLPFSITLLLWGAIRKSKK